jgi:hypothetical protein
MEKNTKTILMVVGVIALAVCGYLIYKNVSEKSGAGIDEKKVNADTKQNTINLVRA